MATCTKCGELIGELHQDVVDDKPYHRTCYFGPAGSAPVPAGPATTGGSTAACASIGTLAVAVGLWLLLNPTVAVETVGAYGLSQSQSVVNLQRLALGQTLTIVGALFLGFALRPR